MADVNPFWLAITTTEVPRPAGAGTCDQHVMVLVQSDTAAHVAVQFPDAEITGPFSNNAEVESARWREIQRHRWIGQEVAIGAPDAIVRL